jgi:hypothetical protein
MGPRAGLDDVERIQILAPTGTRTPYPSAVQPVASRYTDCSIPARFLDVLIHSSMALQPFVGLWPYVQFRNPYTQSVGLLGRGISPSQGRYLHPGQHKQNKRTPTSMPFMGFEPTTPVFKRAKTIHVLDRGATVIGFPIYYLYKIKYKKPSNVYHAYCRSR